MLRKSEKEREHLCPEILLHLNATDIAVLMISMVKYGCDHIAFEIWKGIYVWFKNVL